MTKDSLSKFLFWAVLAILISISTLTYRNLSNYTNEVRSVRHSNIVLRTLEVVLSTIKDAETGHRGYQLTGDTAYLHPYFLSLKTLPAELNKLDSLVEGDHSQSLRIDTLQRLTEDQFAIISKILANTRRSSLFMDRYETDLLSDGRKNMNKIRQLGRRVREVEEATFRVRILSETDVRNIAPIYLLIYGLVPMVGLVYLFTRLLDGLERKRKAEDSLKANILELRKEVAIREFTQKTLRNILDSSLNGIMAFRSIRNKENRIEDFVWILANIVSVKSAGRSEHELIGKRLLTLIPENKAQGLFDIYEKVVESGIPQQFERYHSVEGTYRWLYMTVVKLEDGCIVTYTDITDRKVQNSLLEERAMLLKEAEYVANMGSWKWTEKDDLIWSDGLYKILRITASHQPSWNSFLDNVHPDDAGRVMDFLQDIMSRPPGTKLDYRIQFEEQVHYLSMSVKSIQQEDGQQSYVLGTVVDITERKVYENQLKQYAAELQRSNEDLEQFAYIASHDLQEPLRKIRAFGDRLSTKFHTTLEGQGIDYINRMQSAAERMQRLIEDILAFSRVSRNIGVFEVLNMRKLMDEVVDDLDAQIKREEGTVLITTLPNLQGDKVQIKRLFQNLISNGMKFHRPGEKPTVNISAKTAKSAQILEDYGKTLADAEYACFSVKDNGIGFAEKYRDKIFNIFQRLHGRNEYEGTGIGLSICRKIVINHKGVILTKSEENVGSEFIVILPVE